MQSKETHIARRLVLAAAAFAALVLPAPSPMHAQGVSAVTVPLNKPTGVVYDAAGNFYFSDLNAQLIRKVDTAGIMTVYAGSGSQGFDGDGGPATSASLNQPQGVAMDSANNLYISDTGNNRIRKVTAAGVITTIAGNGTDGFAGDAGLASAATLSRPTAIATDASGNIYFADSNNHRIREIVAATGLILTIAGNGTQGYDGDGGPALNASLDTPQGITIDASGNIYLSDTNNNRVRMIAGGIITTVVGTGAVAFGGDGSAGTAAGLASPRGLAVNSNGTVYIADANNQRIRSLVAGNVSTVAGNGGQGSEGQNGVATSLALDTPKAVAVSPSGFALADTRDELVRGVSNGNIVTLAGIGPQVGNGTLALTVPGQTFVYGQGSLTATLTSATPGSGTITFYDFGAAIGTAPLSGNVASLTISNLLRVGQHSISASFPGDSSTSSAVSSVTVVTVNPAPVTAAGASISVPYGTAIPAISGTLSGILSQDASNVSATFTTTATSTSPAGTYPISATLSGSASTNYTLTSTTGTVTITATGASGIVTSNFATALITSPVTLTATFASSTAGTPTGTVTFFDGATAISGPIVLVNGRASITTTALAAGSHNITASYSGDTNFGPSITPVFVQTISDFAFNITTTGGGGGQTVIPGRTAVFNYTINPVSGSFNFPVALTATNLPPGATATFSPSTLTPGTGAPFTLSIKTTPTVAAVKGIGATTLAALVLLPFAGRLRRRARRMSPLMMLTVFVLTLAAVGGMTGCGSGTGYFGQAQQTYNINVIGTASGPGGTTLQRTATVQLTVQ